MFRWMLRDSEGKVWEEEGMEEKKKSGMVGWLFEGVDKRRRRNGHGPPSSSSGPSLLPSSAAAIATVMRPPEEYFLI